MADTTEQVTTPDWEGFGRAVLGKAYEYGGGDVDGGELQELGVKHRVLIETTITEPCDPEHCICAESGEFPLTCYRIAPKAPQGR